MPKKFFSKSKSNLKKFSKIALMATSALTMSAGMKVSEGWGVLEITNQHASLLNDPESQYTGLRHTERTNYQTLSRSYTSFGNTLSETNAENFFRQLQVSIKENSSLIKNSIQNATLNIGEYAYRDALSNSSTELASNFQLDKDLNLMLNGFNFEVKDIQGPGKMKAELESQRNYQRSITFNPTLKISGQNIRALEEIKFTGEGLASFTSNSTYSGSIYAKKNLRTVASVSEKAKKDIRGIDIDYSVNNARNNGLRGRVIGEFINEQGERETNGMQCIVTSSGIYQEGQGDQEIKLTVTDAPWNFRFIKIDGTKYVISNSGQLSQYFDTRGTVEILGKMIFESKIGYNNTTGEKGPIQVLNIGNSNTNSTLTILDDVYAATSSGRGGAYIYNNSLLKINAQHRDITFNTDINGAIVKDLSGKIEVTGRNRVSLPYQIGRNIDGDVARLAEINLQDQAEREFKNEVYARKISIDRSNVVFKNNVTSTNERAQGDDKKGSLILSNDGKASFEKNYLGDITSPDKSGIVEFLGAGDIFNIGSEQHPIATLILRKTQNQGNNLRTLRGNVYANQIQLWDFNNTPAGDSNNEDVTDALGRFLDFDGSSEIVTWETSTLKPKQENLVNAGPQIQIDHNHILDQVVNEFYRLCDGISENNRNALRQSLQNLFKDEDTNEVDAEALIKYRDKMEENGKIHPQKLIKLKQTAVGATAKQNPDPKPDFNAAAAAAPQINQQPQVQPQAAQAQVVQQQQQVQAAVQQQEARNAREIQDLVGQIRAFNQGYNNLALNGLSHQEAMARLRNDLSQAQEDDQIRRDEEFARQLEEEERLAEQQEQQLLQQQTQEIQTLARQVQAYIPGYNPQLNGQPHQQAIATIRADLVRAQTAANQAAELQRQQQLQQQTQEIQTLVTQVRVYNQGYNPQLNGQPHQQAVETIRADLVRAQTAANQAAELQRQQQLQQQTQEIRTLVEQVQAYIPGYNSQLNGQPHQQAIATIRADLVRAQNAAILQEQQRIAQENAQRLERERRNRELAEAARVEAARLIEQQRLARIAQEAIDAANAANAEILRNQQPNQAPVNNGGQPPVQQQAQQQENGNHAEEEAPVVVASNNQTQTPAVTVKAPATQPKVTASESANNRQQLTIAPTTATQTQERSMNVKSLVALFEARNAAIKKASKIAPVVVKSPNISTGVQAPAQAPAIEQKIEEVVVQPQTEAEVQKEIKAVEKEFSEINPIDIATPECAKMFANQQEVAVAYLSAAQASGNKGAIKAAEQQMQVAQASAILYQETAKQVLKMVAAQSSNILASIVAQAVSAAVTAPTIQMNAVRISSLNSFGASSGSALENFGFWAQGFGGFAEQAQNAYNSPYRATGNGFAVGFDVGNDSGVAGVSYTNASSNLVFTRPEGDLENKTTSHLLTAYGSYFLMPTLQISAQGGGGISNLDFQNGTKKAGKIFLGSAEAKYYLGISEKFSLVPKVGIEYFSSSYGDEDKKSDDKSTGKASIALSPSGSNVDANRTLALFGLGAKTDIVSGDFVISPEVSIGAEVMVSGDEKKMLNKAPVATKAAGEALGEKTDGGNEKITGVIEAAVNVAKANMFKASFGGSYHKRKDFSSINGFLKLSVSF